MGTGKEKPGDSKIATTNAFQGRFRTRTRRFAFLVARKNSSSALSLIVSFHVRPDSANGKIGHLDFAGFFMQLVFATQMATLWKNMYQYMKTKENIKDSRVASF